MSAFETDGQTGRRFDFGKNWAHFLESLKDEKILKAEESLKTMLKAKHLKGVHFLDVGSGSGLFSLAARRLGATVHSFDYDPISVACTNELKRRYFPNDRNWKVEQASVLDRNYLDSIDQFDVVYSWGVLHHTGAMWLAIENVISLVKPNGILFISIYNDQGWKSRFWWFVKFFYNCLPGFLKPFFVYIFGGFFYAVTIIKYSLKLEPMTAISYIVDYDNRNTRGMSFFHDMVDWIGGFPYEVASYELLKSYFHARGFDLINGKQATTAGCHQMVMKKIR